jgi:V/A-type H+-transporting ATPase subunit D
LATQVSGTRSELLARRAQIRLAVQGHDLLKEKRTALVAEFQRISADVLAGAEDLQRLATEGQAALADATVEDGPEAVRSAALVTEREVAVEVISRNVAGVQVVAVRAEAVGRGRTGRGYSLVTTSPRIDLVAERFEAQLQRLLEVAAVELSLRRLAQEISRTTRQVNGLEHVVIPRLAAERDAIALVLEQRELEEQIRVKRARARAAHAGRATQGAAA